MRANESKISSASNTPTTSKSKEHHINFTSLSFKMCLDESISTPKNLSNVFEILEEQLNNGLTAENASNTSFLHLYYLVRSFIHL